MQGPALNYLLLVIPAIFALAVIGQGITKMMHNEKDGPVALAFGLIFILLIAAAYFLFIR